MSTLITYSFCAGPHALMCPHFISCPNINQVSVAEFAAQKINMSSHNPEKAETWEHFFQNLYHTWPIC